MRFLINVLTTNERVGWVHPILNDFLNQAPFFGEHLISVRTVHNHIPAAAGRNYAAKKVKDLPKEDRPDWWVMIDNDMCPPMNLLESVKDAPADAMVVVPVFHMWDEGKGTTIVCWGMDDKEEAVIDEQKYHQLTKCGTGVIFIRPELLDSLEMPYFWYPYNELQGIEGTEDIKFCEKVLAAGKKIYGNSSVLVGHLHNVNLAVLANSFAKLRHEKQLAESRLEAVASPA